MTMIIATKLNETALHLHCDSIETSEVSIESGMIIPEGTTSQNEDVKPEHLSGERYRIFRERVCKIGRLSNRVACSVAGDANFAYEILGMLSTSVDTIDNLTKMADVLKSIKSSLVGTKTYIDSSCTLLFTCMFEKLYVCGAFFTVLDGGSRIHLNLRNCPIDHPNLWQFTEGSGIEYMKEFLPLGTSGLLNSDHTVESITTELLCLDYSTWIRFKNQGRASGVGGAIFGLKMTEKGCEYMKDTMFLYADYRGSLEIAVKIMYRNGIFFITDFIKKSLTAMRTLESEVLYRKTGQQSDITTFIKEAFSFQTPVILVDSRLSSAPLEPNVGIIENSKGAVGGVNFNVKFEDGLPYLPQGTSVNLKTEKVSYNFIVRLP